MLLEDTLVKDLALSRPGATAVFRRHRIDFCCNGAVPLREAAAKRGLDAAALAQELVAATSPPQEAAPKQPSALIAYILENFHDVHRRELEELIRLARRVEAVHKEHPACPHGLGAFLEETAEELEAHMQKEEAVLFPMLGRGLGAMAGMPMQCMRLEHTEHGQRLEELARLTSDFTPPQGACTSWRALYAGCAKLDGDLREHIHLENNLLFPMFESVDPQVCGCGGAH